jgi:hypothetical protein
MLIYALVLLLASMSVVGIFNPGIYALETENWTAQAVGQDWVDLSFGVPWLALANFFARRGSRRARLLLAGGLLNTAYVFVIYAFAMHFNAMFPVYVAGLGISLVSLAACVHELATEDVQAWFRDGAPRLGPGILLVSVGACFTLLWLAEIVPAMARGATPASVLTAGLLTNPVHVLDLSLILPAHIAAGVFLMRRRPLGYLLAPIVLGFGVLMAASIGGMMVVMVALGVAVNFGVAVAMFGLSAVSAGFLISMLRALRVDPAQSPSRRSA